MIMSLSDCKFIELPKNTDVRGNLTFIEGHNHVPFCIKRVYYIYDVPAGSKRGSHAHRTLQQFLVALSGSFDVVLNDGTTEHLFHLNRPFYGLYVCPMMWRTLDNFSSGSVCMVLASERYTEDDYVHDWDTFQRLTR